MTTVKKAVSLDSKIVDEVQKLVPKGGFSAFTNTALAAHIQHEKLNKLMQEDLATRGTIDETVLRNITTEILKSQ